IKAVQQMNRARSGGREANADFSGKLCMAARHECRHFFVAHLDKINLVLCAIQRTKDAVDAVAGVSIDARYSPFVQPLNQKITACISHMDLPQMRSPLNFSMFVKERNSRTCIKDFRPSFLHPL